MICTLIKIEMLTDITEIIIGDAHHYFLSVSICLADVERELKYTFSFYFHQCLVKLSIFCCYCCCFGCVQSVCVCVPLALM